MVHLVWCMMTLIIQYKCVKICVYVYVCVYICLRMYICMCTLHACKCTCYVHIYVCTCTYRHIYTNKEHTFTGSIHAAASCTYMYMHMYIHAYVRTYICTCMYNTYIKDMHICTYMYIHIKTIPSLAAYTQQPLSFFVPLWQLGLLERSAYICMCVCIYTQKHVCNDVAYFRRLHMYVCMHVCMHVHIHMSAFTMK